MLPITLMLVLPPSPITEDPVAAGVEFGSMDVLAARGVFNS